MAVSPPTRSAPGATLRVAPSARRAATRSPEQSRSLTEAPASPQFSLATSFETGTPLHQNLRCNRRNTFAGSFGLDTAFAAYTPIIPKSTPSPTSVLNVPNLGKLLLEYRSVSDGWPTSQPRPAS